MLPQWGSVSVGVVTGGCYEGSLWYTALPKTRAVNGTSFMKRKVLWWHHSGLSPLHSQIAATIAACDPLREVRMQKFANRLRTSPIFFHENAHPVSYSDRDHSTNRKGRATVIVLVSIHLSAEQILNLLGQMLWSQMWRVRTVGDVRPRTKDSK